MLERKAVGLLVVITAKIQIFPSESDVLLLQDTYDAYNQACNWISEHIFQSKVLSFPKLNVLYYTDLRNIFALRSQMAQSVIKTVIARYKSAKSNGHAWSKVNFKLLEYDLVWNRDYSLKDKLFSVNTLAGRIKVKYQKKKMKKYFDGSWSFGTAKLVYKLGKWYLHIPVSKNIACLDLPSASNVVGVDLGINFLSTTYDYEGKTTFYDGRTVKNKRGQYKALRKQLQKRQTPSSRKRIKAIGQRENRYMSDVNHQVTKALVDKYPPGTCFALEELTGIRKATEKVRVNNRYVTVSWAFYQFRQMLEYKARLKGQVVVLLPPAYTSQTCPKCGHIDKANRNKKLHSFCCKNCTYKSNDDRIGAMNLQRMGADYISTVTA
jgi:IS605 OrfB family transposase